MRAALIILLCLCVGTATAADPPRQLMWKDLAPKAVAIENPFAQLGREQLQTLAEIAAVRDRRARGDKTLAGADVADEQAATRKLEKAGVDVDGLLAKRREMSEQKKAGAHAPNMALEGQLVRLPGYVLPLEISGRQVTEFLLVPWVGACIHTPPPPANQIVHVKTDTPFELSGMFMAVWVTGRMSTTGGRRSLTLVDGSSDIDIGYALRASRVEAYRE
ncbi:MAG: DUF3299 domain-containing protein [Betaproteobacteria bacterium]|jgi:hypothetical protein